MKRLEDFAIENLSLEKRMEIAEQVAASEARRPRWKRFWRKWGGPMKVFAIVGLLLFEADDRLGDKVISGFLGESKEVVASYYDEFRIEKIDKKPEFLCEDKAIGPELFRDGTELYASISQNYFETSTIFKLIHNSLRKVGECEGSYICEISEGQVYYFVRYDLGLSDFGNIKKLDIKTGSSQILAKNVSLYNFYGYEGLCFSLSPDNGKIATVLRLQDSLYNLVLINTKTKKITELSDINYLGTSSDSYADGAVGVTVNWIDNNQLIFSERNSILLNYNKQQATDVYLFKNCEKKQQILRLNVWANLLDVDIVNKQFLMHASEIDKFQRIKNNLYVYGFDGELRNSVECSWNGRNANFKFHPNKNAIMYIKDDVAYRHNLLFPIQQLADFSIICSNQEDMNEYRLRFQTRKIIITGQGLYYTELGLFGETIRLADCGDDYYDAFLLPDNKLIVGEYNGNRLKLSKLEFDPDDY